MAMLSYEINRFLGNALLDPALLKCIFSNERARALQGYNLGAEERSTILASHARSLSELSRELTLACATPDMADTNAGIDKFYQSLHANDRQPAVHMESIARRILDTLPAQQSFDAVAETEKFAKLKAAS